MQAVNPDPFRGRWGGAHCRDSLQQTCRPCDCRPVLECDDYSSNATVGGATVDRYRCAAEDEYVHELEELFAHSMAGQCAAMFVEPIQGVGGVVQYPHGYVRRASELVRARGGLMVADEVRLLDRVIRDQSIKQQKEQMYSEIYSNSKQYIL